MRRSSGEETRVSGRQGNEWRERHRRLRRLVRLAGSSARCIFISAEPQRQGNSTGITTGRPQTGQESLKERSYHCTKSLSLPRERNAPSPLLNSTERLCTSSLQLFLLQAFQAGTPHQLQHQINPKGHPPHGAVAPATVFVVPDWPAD